MLPRFLKKFWLLSDEYSLPFVTFTTKVRYGCRRFASPCLEQNELAICVYDKGISASVILTIVFIPFQHLIHSFCPWNPLCSPFGKRKQREMIRAAFWLVNRKKPSTFSLDYIRNLNPLTSHCLHFRRSSRCCSLPHFRCCQIPDLFLAYLSLRCLRSLVAFQHCCQFLCCSPP